jgi:hypothetical protein
MPAHRILYLSESVLEDAELYETESVVDAVKHASECPPDLTAEVWSDEGKAAVVRPSWTSDVPPDASPAVKVGKAIAKRAFPGVEDGMQEISEALQQLNQSIEPAR